MAYLKPSFTAKVYDRIVIATGVGDSETLTVTKRGSNQPQIIPVTPVDVGGTRYLVSTRGESQWVKNIRVNPKVTLTNKAGITKYIARETLAPDRPPILAVYREKASKTIDRYFFANLPDPADHPVFALTETT